MEVISDGPYGDYQGGVLFPRVPSGHPGLHSKHPLRGFVQFVDVVDEWGYTLSTRFAGSSLSAAWYS